MQLGQVVSSDWKRGGHRHTASQPPEPEAEDCRPAWLEPPADVVPGIVPVELLLARTDTHAVLVDGLLVYPTGFDFELAVRRRPGQPRHHQHRWMTSSAWRSASPTAAPPTTTPAAGPAPSATSRPTRRCLYQSSDGPEGGHVWLWGLPPPGPLAFVCSWPAGQIPASGVEIDAGLVLEAADRAASVWPTG